MADHMSRGVAVGSLYIAFLKTTWHIACFVSIET